MKKISILLFTAALIFISCDDNKKNMTNQFDILMKESDSIEVAHTKFADTHKQMVNEHNAFSEELNGMELQDSTILDDVAKHGVMLERHDAILMSHNEIMKSHSNLRAKFDNLSDVEKTAKIEEMEKGHDKMMREHATMKDEHDAMKTDYNTIREKISDTEENKNDMK
ncbi:hypothetical protein [Winogradskyella bathintestinalis]|uniref:Lipoprotein n=1 Tax=Winogradskyella bathintestinalis TaxID=3035208 RepID=A0ABT7ZUS3_9FLAO|nr:hypothetical protein [Winogradskyella bathintestinalis]MDN3492473.1 hypothetical protein [Winogradskyella bathintestinalis]